MSSFSNKNKKKTPQTSNQNKPNQTNLPSNPWHVKENKSQNNQPKETKNAVNKQNSSKAKFKEAQQEHLQAAKKHIENYESSSEEEDLDSDALLKTVFKGYGGDKEQLRKTQEFLENIFLSGAATCLICIATVKRSDYVSFWMFFFNKCSYNLQ